jgi:hypothetical protein
LMSNQPRKMAVKSAKTRNEANSPAGSGATVPAAGAEAGRVIASVPCTPF